MQGGIFIVVFSPSEWRLASCSVFFLLFQLGKSGILYGVSVRKCHRKKSIGQLIYLRHLLHDRATGFLDVLRKNLCSDKQVVCWCLDFFPLGLIGKEGLFA